LWDDTFDKMLEEVVSRELEGYKKVMKSYKLIQINGHKVACSSKVERSSRYKLCFTVFDD